MKRLRKLGLAVLLAVLLAPPALAQTGSALMSETESERHRKLQMKFVCQCGCNYILLHCRHNLRCSSAPGMRAALLGEMGGGQSDDRIVAAMVARFGMVARSEPPAEGFNLLGWVMPYVALLGGLFLAFGVARVWRKRAPATAATPRDAALLDKHRSAVEHEMRELE